MRVWRIVAVSCAFILSAAAQSASGKQRLAPPAPFSPAKYERLKARSPVLAQKLTHPQLIDQRAAPPPPGLSPWTALSQPFPLNPNTGQTISPGAMILLTDGTVMIQDQGPTNNGSADWFRLSPDISGSYVNGTWTQLASIPAAFNYAPLYFASGVLPDGRVLIEGGEYNFGNLVWTDQGAIYDPVVDSWTAVNPPDGGAGNWVRIGDAPSSILASGTFMIGASGYSGTTDQALFDPTTLSWTTTGVGKADGNGEEGWSLLPDGDLLTVDVDNPGAPNLTNSEIYSAATGSWASASSSLVQLEDSDHEIGPQVLRPNGTVYASGATQHNAVFNTSTKIWAAAPDFPIISRQQYDASDAAAAVLPNGKVLILPSPGPGQGQTPVQALLFDGTRFSKTTAPPNAANLTAFYNFMIVLPNGQILLNDRIGHAEVYQGAGSAAAAWRPTITSVPKTLIAGQTYVVSGTQLCGLTQAAAYGDDYQPFTDYPLVRITNSATKHVFYARTVKRSTSSVAPGAAGSTSFTLPGAIETGASTLMVVANGIASKAVAVSVTP